MKKELSQKALKIIKKMQQNGRKHAVKQKVKRAKGNTRKNRIRNLKKVTVSKCEEKR